MPRQPGVYAQNNFLGGLKTEASALNFPENACTATTNCIFDIIGTVERRQAINLENGFVSLSGVNAEVNKAVSSYFWRNVNGDGNINFFVFQVGDVVGFCKIVDGTALSSNYLGAPVILSSFGTSSIDPGTVESQFSDGDGYLFIVNPYITPLAVNYDPVAGTFATTVISIQVRDFEGVPEPGVPISLRPSTMSWAHRYNLLNQGWSESPFGDASQSNLNGQFFAGGNSGALSLASYPYPAPINAAIVTAIAPQILPGVATATIAQNIINNYDNAFFNTLATLPNGVYPSNADVWGNYKDNFGAFNPTIAQLSLINSGATRAPNGHFIMDAFNQDRRAIITGTSGTPVSAIPLAVTSSGNFRPSVTAFHAGRVWYSGVNAPGFSSNIYFSQIIDVNVDPTSQFGQCYQLQDPTSDTLFDLLPTDGGMIKIANCGTIYKLFPLQGAIIVFASNGVWAISGSQGLGFTATDYSISKISSIRTLSSSSFVDVLGFPLWWTTEGIYTMVVDPTHGGFRIDSLTDTTISSFYHNIPQANLSYVRGYYNPSIFTVQWVFKQAVSTGSADFTRFDSILNWNKVTGAFFPWTISPTTTVTAAAVRGIVCVDTGLIENPDGTRQNGHAFKYITTYLQGSNVVSFAETNGITYKDWASLSDGSVDFTSSFTTGFGIHGQGFRKFQPTYIYIFSDNTLSSAYKFQGQWDFADAKESGRFTNSEVINNDADSFGTVYNRIRLRGSGLALQYTVTSITGQPFTIVGWVVPETSDAGV